MAHSRCLLATYTGSRLNKLVAFEILALLLQRYVFDQQYVDRDKGKGSMDQNGNASLYIGLVSAFEIFVDL